MARKAHVSWFTSLLIFGGAFTLGMGFATLRKKKADALATATQPAATQAAS